MKTLLLIWVCLVLMTASAWGQVSTINLRGTIAANALYVTTNGNNATGRRGSLSPFATIGAAKTNAVSGDTIYVQAGTYFENDLAKDGLTVQCQGGVTISYDAEDYKPGNGRGIVDDRYIGAVTFKLLGRPDIYYSTGTNSSVVTSGAFDNQGFALCSNSLAAVIVTNPASRITLDLGRCSYDTFTPGTTLGFITILNCTNAIVHADEILNPYFGRLLLTTNADPDVGSGFISLRSGAVMVYWEAGPFYLDCPHIGICDTYSIWTQEPTGRTTNSMWFTGSLVESKLYLSGHSGTYRLWAQFKELHTTNAAAECALSVFGGKNYIQCEKISDDLVEAVSVSGGSATNVNELWLTVQKISSPSRWLDVGNNCIAHVTCQEFEEINTPDALSKILVSSGGTLTLDGQDARAGGKILDYQGGKAVIKNMELRSTNNVAVHASGSGLLLQNCLLISKTASNSIYSTTAQNVGVVGGMANVAKAASTTIQPGTLTVDANLQ